MAIVTSIAGPSGMGKTRSLKNMNWDNTFILRANKKPLPFKNRLEHWDNKEKTGNYYYSNDYGTISAIIQKLPEYGFKSIIIDDSTHLMTDEFMDKIDTKGYDKYSEMAANYYNMLKVAESLPDDIRVYVVNHVEDTSNGDTKIKTIGKMLDEKVDIPSLLTIALGATKVKEGHKFRTQSTGRDFYKSPEDMFEEELIDNDLKIVDDAIKEYYGLEE